MQVIISNEELKVIEDALDAWEKQPHDVAFARGMVGGILGSVSGKHGEDMVAKAESLKHTAEIETMRRKRVSVLLRAKLLQSAAISSEHEIAS